MTSTNDQRLFDMEAYGGDQTPKEHRTASREASSSRPLPPIETLTDGWRLIRNRGGVLPYAHLVKVTSSEGSALTLCDQWGTTLPRFDVMAALYRARIIRATPRFCSGMKPRNARCSTPTSPDASRTLS